MLTHAGALVLPAVPLLVLLGCLLLGSFPGERTIARVSRRLAAARRRPARREADRSPARSISLIPRGGLLIAAGVARRPPPALA